jgi:hypothetical protein
MMLLVPYPMSVAAIRFRHASALLLMVIALVACAHPPPPPYPSGPPAAVLDRLLADYLALGLLVEWDLPHTTLWGPDGKIHILRHLAFELPSHAGDPQQQHRLLVGTEQFTIGMGHEVDDFGPDDGTILPVELTIRAAEGIRARYDYPWEHSGPAVIYGGRWGMVHSTNAALATAIQAKARGWDALAERLLAVASTNSGAEEACYELPGAPPRQALALLARAHFALEWDKPGADRTAIARRLTAAVAFDPALPHCKCYWFVRRFDLPMDACWRR